MKELIIDLAEDLLWALGSLNALPEYQKMLITIVVSILASVGTVLVATGRLGM